MKLPQSHKCSEYPKLQSCWWQDWLTCSCMHLAIHCSHSSTAQLKGWGQESRVDSLHFIYVTHLLHTENISHHCGSTKALHLGTSNTLHMCTLWRLMVQFPPAIFVGRGTNVSSFKEKWFFWKTHNSLMLSLVDVDADLDQVLSFSTVTSGFSLAPYT